MSDSTPPPMARPRMAAGLLLRDHSGRVLMVKPTYKDGWDIPGGYVEPSESPAQACARETVEELALDRAPGRLLVVDWAPHPGEGDKLLFIFDGGTLTSDEFDALTPDRQEIAEARFWPVDQLHDITPPRLTRRLLLAIDAANSQRTEYAEHGTSTQTVPTPLSR